MDVFNRVAGFRGDDRAGRVGGAGLRRRFRVLPEFVQTGEGEWFPTSAFIPCVMGADKRPPTFTAGLSARCGTSTMLERHRYGILNHCDYPIHTSKLVGVNNKIKVIKRKVYGYRDQRYFTLKINQAFSGAD